MFVFIVYYNEMPKRLIIIEDELPILQLANFTTI